jgi:hypothetical protein
MEMETTEEVLCEIVQPCVDEAAASVFLSPNDAH